MAYQTRHELPRWRKPATTTSSNLVPKPMTEAQFKLLSSLWGYLPEGTIDDDAAYADASKVICRMRASELITDAIAKKNKRQREV